MFIGQAIVLDIEFEAARPRMIDVVTSGKLDSASRVAYQDGLTALMRVGPLGDVRGAAKLVRVRFLDPFERDGGFRVGLRWEATGITAGLFPVLDGDFTLSPADRHTTRLTLVGVYRPPIGRLGAALDALVLHKVAEATVRSLLRSVADALTIPAAGAQSRNVQRRRRLRALDSDRQHGEGQFPGGGTE